MAAAESWHLRTPGVTRNLAVGPLAKVVAQAVDLHRRHPAYQLSLRRGATAPTGLYRLHPSERGWEVTYEHAHITPLTEMAKTEISRHQARIIEILNDFTT